MKTKLFLLSLFFAFLFTLFSYTVAKEQWQRIDFDSMVRLQDNISRRFDGLFSYFSLVGSVEVTIGLCALFAFASLMRKRFLASAGWLMIIPATAIEVFGKLVIFHPGPPAFLHRSLLPSGLPSFYVHTNFSYPSGHMTRTVFIITVLASLIFFYKSNYASKLIALSLLFSLVLIMGLTRVYLGEHWFSDVLGGAFLGVSSGFFASLLILRGKRV